MRWTSPQHARGQVDWAGDILVKTDNEADTWGDEDWADYERALAIINNWRAAHHFPLNTFQVGLRRRAKQVDSTSLVAQRIKRLYSIRLKLARFEKMKLSRMQDIGGCRAILESVKKVYELTENYKSSALKHRRVGFKDYIQEPQSTGYRGVHLIYAYNSDKSQTYNGLRIEMQFRSPLQHAWATAVETVGTFIRQALKSSQGEVVWLRFFALMGTALALREGTPPVPGTPQEKAALLRELRPLVRQLEVEKRLRAYGAAIRTLESPERHDAAYFLLVLEPGAHTVTITSYGPREYDQAAAQYLETERRISKVPGAEAVLVSVDSLAALRRAYPNYFLDTTAFIDAMKQAIR
jgi:ppGpp synthetase/RelA/SpoT-type nucleotidyltranferase